jgi:hypothetical protein
MPTRKFARRVTEYTRPWQEKKNEKAVCNMGVMRQFLPTETTHQRFPPGAVPS